MLISLLKSSFTLKWLLFFRFLIIVGNFDYTLILVWKWLDFEGRMNPFSKKLDMKKIENVGKFYPLFVVILSNVRKGSVCGIRYFLKFFLLQLGYNTIISSAVLGRYVNRAEGSKKQTRIKRGSGKQNTTRGYQPKPI